MPAPTLPAFGRLAGHFHQKTDEGKIPGAVILLAQGEHRWLDVYGKQQVEQGVALSENTIFRLASMTKPLTSVAALMLLEAGKLRLDDPLEKYLPAFAGLRVLHADGRSEALRRSITVEDLLLHTSGVANNFFQNTAAERAYGAAFLEKHPASLGEVVEIVSQLPLAHQPGEGWTYGFSTDVLARVIEIASGETIDVFFQKHIFGPLKMTDTGFQVPAEKLPRLAAVYGRNGQVTDPGGPNSPFANGQNYPRGVGGLVSTAHDYLRFCQMLLGGGALDGVRLLKIETVRNMMKNHLPGGVLPHSPGMPPICNGFGYGFGVQTREVLLGSPGDCAWPGACLTYFFIDPSHGGIGLFFTQSTDFSNLPLLGDFHRMASAVFAEGN